MELPEKCKCANPSDKMVWVDTSPARIALPREKPKETGSEKIQYSLMCSNCEEDFEQKVFGIRRLYD